MEKQDLKVIDQIIQKDYKNLQGRSAILDCVARDSEGKQFDVEIQQDNEGASPKRARYHSGLMDMNTLNPGQDFDELPESYVIFITFRHVVTSHCDHKFRYKSRFICQWDMKKSRPPLSLWRGGLSV